MANYYGLTVMIMKLENISRYYPEVMPFGEGVQYFRSEEGKDFYESIPLFKRKYKLCIEPDTGIIRSIAEDVSTFYPVGFSVVETNYLPENCDIYGGWKYENEIVTAVSPVLIKSAESELKLRLTRANEVIETLQDAIDLGMATDEEISLLTAWKKFRVLLSRVDITKAPDIVWPVQPE